MPHVRRDRDELGHRGDRDDHRLNQGLRDKRERSGLKKELRRRKSKRAEGINRILSSTFFSFAFSAASSSSSCACCFNSLVHLARGTFSEHHVNTDLRSPFLETSVASVCDGSALMQLCLGEATTRCWLKRLCYQSSDKDRSTEGAG